MCCFTRLVKSVNDTRIYARPDADGRQFIVYQMQFESREDLAMILPLPVKPDAGEKAVTFISLESYPGFFDDLESGFPSESIGGRSVRSASIPNWHRAQKLEVYQVGEFEASFVPTVNDFSRLDERFRMPSGTWTKIPAYETYGFAVFKLKKGAHTVHPMAFSFPRRDPAKLFVPTVHIHDGRIHGEAEFDHLLYCQPREDQPLALLEWRESPRHARNFMKLDRAKGLLEPDEHCYRKEIRGLKPNHDIWVDGAV